LKAPFLAIPRRLGWALLATGAATAFTAWWTDEAQDAAATQAAELLRPDPRPPSTGAGALRAPVTDRANSANSANSANKAHIANSASISLPARAAWSPATPTALAAWGQPLAQPAPPRSVALAASTARGPLAASAPGGAASAPAAPEAPTPVFRYAGRITTEGSRRAMLLTPQGTLVVRERDTIEGQWRVDHIADESLLLTWLPGGLPKRLPYAS
jgi:hypothetical protein